ncbi:MAG: hypothetical protein P9M07_03820 [Candidatus Aceula meridiana]|nr:hypothetical protein [Candidatus Aceula meridiana]
MKRKILWALIVIIIWITIRAVSILYLSCMDTCTENFKGAYPEIACKYECSFFNKFKKPTKKP